MPNLRPWVRGPFEVLFHAELHYRVGEDFDRRIAMIGFDNAIEVCVTSYLGLHPVQRGDREYRREDVDGWLRNFHTKIEFYFIECTARSVTSSCDLGSIIYYHNVRNDQYHGGRPGVPEREALAGCRASAMEIFGVLFDEPDVEDLLDIAVAETNASALPVRTDQLDAAIDDEHGLIDLCGELRYSSDLLYALDPIQYRDTALSLLDSSDEDDTE